MSKIIEQWLLFEYVGLEFTPLSKPFKTREQNWGWRDSDKKIPAVVSEVIPESRFSLGPMPTGVNV